MCLRKKVGPLSCALPGRYSPFSLRGARGSFLLFVGVGCSRTAARMWEEDHAEQWGGAAAEEAAPTHVYYALGLSDPSLGAWGDFAVAGTAQGVGSVKNTCGGPRDLGEGGRLIIWDLPVGLQFAIKEACAASDIWDEEDRWRHPGCAEDPGHVRGRGSTQGSARAAAEALGLAAAMSVAGWGLQSRRERRRGPPGLQPDPAH